MNTTRIAHLATVSLFVAALAAVITPDPPNGQAAAAIAADPPDGHAVAIHALAPAAERARIRAHLLGAERMLRAANVSHLSHAQREGRARAIELLHEYRLRGVFPHNHDHPGERVPYFVDRHGTLCAMAYLIARTGGEEIVESVSRTANNAYVADLAGDPAFRDWLERHGMTVAEAARVQPSYGCCFRSSNDGVDKEYALASVGSAALSGAAFALQLMDDGEPDGWRSVLGIAAAGIGFGLAVDGFDGSDGFGDTLGDEDVALLNLATSGAAIAPFMWRLIQGPNPAAKAEEDPAEARSGLSWSARPAFAGENGIGFRFTIRF